MFEGKGAVSRCVEYLFVTCPVFLDGFACACVCVFLDVEIHGCCVEFFFMRGRGLVDLRLVDTVCMYVCMYVCIQTVFQLK